MSIKNPGTGGLAAGAGGSLKLGFTDTSGTPGNATINTARGRFSFVAVTSAVTITNNTVSTSSTVLLSLGGTDATLTSVRVTCSGGSFLVTGNANSAGAPPCDFVVVN